MADNIFKKIKRIKSKLLENRLSDREKFSDIKEDEFWDIYDKCTPFTMTSVERMYSLYKSVNYILEMKIEGDFVECGVWRGGSSMLIAYMLKNRSISDRKIYLYDTFEGMSEPTSSDIDTRGTHASVLMDNSIDDKESSVWCLATINDVEQNMKATSYVPSNIIYVKGKVENTIPTLSPDKVIALLRLDTDWYESTKHELIHLYPELTKGGVLIIDDYGHWDGCRKAVDEYFNNTDSSILLNRVDYTGRLGIKP
jgi:O-methyltransferase